MTRGLLLALGWALLISAWIYMLYPTWRGDPAVTQEDWVRAHILHGVLLLGGGVLLTTAGVG